MVFDDVAATRLSFAIQKQDHDKIILYEPNPNHTIKSQIKKRMIVSHKYKFIFIKVHKTAGSSMEAALGPLCGEDDIVTPMDLDKSRAKNYYEPTLVSRAYAKSRLVRKCIDRHSPLLGKWYYEHMPAVRVRELVGEEVWGSYYKFCFERNPWEKVVSYYNWKKFGQKRKMPSFRDYVLKKTHRLPLDARLYFDGETNLMDEVIDFKNFKTSFSEVCSKLGIPYDGKMPNEKTNITAHKVDYRDFYDDETKNKVAQEFRREIKLMGYVFDPSI